MRSGIGKFFYRKKDGAAAIEFGLLFFPFFLLVLGIIEIALMFAAAAVLEGSAHAATRVLRTGQAQQSGDALTMFEQTMCDSIGGLIDCDGIIYEVLLSPDGSFSSLDVQPQYDDDGNLISRGFDPGQENSVIIVRLTYNYEFITPYLSALVTGRSDNRVPLISTVSVRNEPYDF